MRGVADHAMFAAVIDTAGKRGVRSGPNPR